MKKRIVALGLLVSGLLAGPVSAQETAPDPEIAEEEADAFVDLEWFGYVRTGYEFVQNDESIDYIGENSGFILQNARLGTQGSFGESGLSFVLSIDGADTRDRRMNDPLAELNVALRDAYLRQEIHSAVGLQVGQFKAPFIQEELRSTRALIHASRAVGVEGVLPGRGFEQAGLGQGRQLGLMLSPSEPVFFGDFGFSYALALMNGNGTNRSVNDSNRIGLYGRLALHWSDMVTLGAGVLRNDRRVGELPNRFNEEDFGISGDLSFSFEGFDLFGQVIHQSTSFQDIDAPDRDQLAWHAEASYTFAFDALPIHFAPSYRFAYFHPRFGDEETDDGLDLDGFELTYHTVGVRLWHPRAPLTTYVNYTFTMESDERELDNDRFELILQAEF